MLLLHPHLEIIAVSMFAAILVEKSGTSRLVESGSKSGVDRVKFLVAMASNVICSPFIRKMEWGRVKVKWRKVVVNVKWRKVVLK